MATIIQSGITGQINLGTADDLILSPTGQILTSSIGIFGTGTSHEVNILGAIAVGSTGLRLDATGAVSHEILIGRTGQIITQNIGIFIQGDGAEISNAGTITAGSGIVARNDTLFVNTGDITSQFSGVLLDDNAIINNSGQIVAGGTAISVELNALIANSGEISGQDYGIQVETGQITNSGTIFQLDSTNPASGTFYAAIRSEAATGSLRVTNTGDILSQEYGIAAEDLLFLTNSGNIASQTQDAIRAGDNASISNTGTITSSQRAITALEELILHNTGDIIGRTDAIVGSGEMEVINEGSILGNEVAIQTSSTLSLSNSGTISISYGRDGIVDFPEFAIIGAIVDVSNTGVISAGDYASAISAQTFINYTGAGILSAGSSAFSVSSFDASSAIINNSGTITAGAGLFQASSTVQDDFDIHLQNDGAIAVTLFWVDSFTMGGGLLITNSGSMSAGSLGIDLTDQLAGFGVTIQNSGTMTTGDDLAYSNNSISGVFATSLSGGSLELDNSGTMAIVNDVFFQRSGVADLRNSGQLSALGNILEVNGPMGNTYSGSLENTGTLSADQGLAEIDVDGSVRITNTGDITANFGVRADFDTTVSAEFRNAGDAIFTVGEVLRITGEAYLENSGNLQSSQRTILQLSDDATKVVNTGTILSDQDFIQASAGNVFVSNDGAISTTGGITATVSNIDLRNTGTLDTGTGYLASTEDDVVLRNGQDGQILGFTDSDFGSIPFVSPLVSGANVVVRNDGFIDSGSAGFSGFTLLDISNSGTMNVASDLAQYGSGQAGILRNSGTMNAGQYIATSQGASVDILNLADGQMAAQSVFSSFSDGIARLVNHGSIATTQAIMSHGGFGFGQLNVNNIGSMSSSSSVAAFDTYLATANIRNQGNIQSEGALVSTEEGTIIFWNTGTATAKPDFK